MEQKQQSTVSALCFSASPKFNLCLISSLYIGFKNYNDNCPEPDEFMKFFIQRIDVENFKEFGKPLEIFYQDNDGIIAKEEFHRYMGKQIYDCLTELAKRVNIQINLYRFDNDNSQMVNEHIGVYDSLVLIQQINAQQGLQTLDLCTNGSHFSICMDMYDLGDEKSMEKYSEMMHNLSLGQINADKLIALKHHWESYLSSKADYFIYDLGFVNIDNSAEEKKKEKLELLKIEKDKLEQEFRDSENIRIAEELNSVYEFDGKRLNNYVVFIKELIEKLGPSDKDEFLEKVGNEGTTARKRTLAEMQISAQRDRIRTIHDNIKALVSHIDNDEAILGKTRRDRMFVSMMAKLQYEEELGKVQRKLNEVIDS